MMDVLITFCKEIPQKDKFIFQKRVLRGIRYYYYKPIEDSPFSVVVSLPDHYGRHQVDAVVETHLLKSSKSESLKKVFEVDSS